jgi:cation transport regulator ChaB
MKKTLVLEGNLSRVRMMLEQELSNVIKQQVTEALTEDIEKARVEAGIEEKITKVTWEFHPESDDEGGTDWWIYYVNIHGENGVIDAEEINYTKKSSWSDRMYEASLQEEIREVLGDWRDDLYTYGIEEILL